MLVEIKKRIEFQTWLGTVYNIKVIRENDDYIILHTRSGERIELLKEDIMDMKPLVIMTEVR